MQPIGPLGFAPSERTGGKQGKGLRHFSMKVREGGFMGLGVRVRPWRPGYGVRVYKPLNVLDLG